MNTNPLPMFMVGGGVSDVEVADRPMYARVWRAHLDWSKVPDQKPSSMSTIIPAAITKNDEQPVGVVIVNPLDPFWLKIDGKWVSSRTDRWGEKDLSGPYFQLEYITQAEYESDLAFGLWPTVRITYRPVRKWWNRKKHKIGIWNRNIAMFNIFAFFSCLEHGVKNESGLLIALATVCAAHGLGTISVLLYRMTWPRNE